MPEGVLHSGLMLTEMKHWFAMAFFGFFLVFTGKIIGFLCQTRNCKLAIY